MNDRMGLLLEACEDCIGAVSIRSQRTRSKVKIVDQEVGGYPH